MIRQPSTKAALYRWHREAVAGIDPPIHDGLPECGWFKTKLIKGGPWVGVEITCQQPIDPETGELIAPETYHARADGIPRDAAKLWTFLTPITRAEFLALQSRREAIPQMAATMARLDLTERAIRP